jgi:hypothetical protein
LILPSRAAGLELGKEKKKSLGEGLKSRRLRARVRRAGLTPRRGLASRRKGPMDPIIWSLADCKKQRALTNDDASPLRRGAPAV